MAATTKTSPAPKWVIDLHGINEALTTLSNSKARIIDAIQSGEMLIMRSVQSELKALYPKLWNDFVAIKPRKYLNTTIAVSVTAGQMQGAHGSSILGGIPAFAHFEAVAVARANGCKLVSAGKGLSNCRSIAARCNLPPNDIVGIDAV
jgi:hypothetical protein